MRRQRQAQNEYEFSDEEDREAFTSASRNEATRQLNTYKISRVKRNHRDEKYLSLAHEDFSYLAWQKLGYYIARNDQLECLSLRRCNLSDENMSAFFHGAARNKQIKVLTLYGNSFGAEGMKSLMPFLQYSHNLTSLNVSGNNIETEGLRWLLQGLGNNGCIEKLNLRHCGLCNMSILDKPHVYLPNLQVLYLSDNSNIGAEGCSSIASLLRSSGSKMKKFYLNRCHIGDEGVQFIAESLVNNTSLCYLELETNNIRRKGLIALLKLLNNVDTIQATYNSNHVLKRISLKGNPSQSHEIIHCIESALKLNQQYDGEEYHHHDVGRAKVIQSQLQSQTRIILSCIQGVDDYYMRPYGNITSEVVSNYLASVGQESNLSDLYQLMLGMNSELGAGN